MLYLAIFMIYFFEIKLMNFIDQVYFKSEWAQPNIGNYFCICEQVYHLTIVSENIFGAPKI